MAAVKSLGVHTPVALTYLVAEGLLPPDPNPNLYQWETYVTEQGAESVEEEVLATRNVVAWSQGKFIRNVYHFNLDGEDVVQALLTTFPAPTQPKDHDSTRVINGNGSGRPRRTRNLPHAPASPQPDDEPLHANKACNRALVVLLKSKAYIYFLRGSPHVVELPFEVERAFAAPRGLILQRKSTAQRSLPNTPQVPAAPPNSFWSMQGLPGSSLRHSMSPTLVRSFAKASFTNSKSAFPSPLAGNAKLDALFQNIIAPPGKREDDDVTNLYSLTSPFSDLGVVTYSLQHHKPRMSGKVPAGLSVEFEGLDPGERIVYVTAKDEFSSLEPYKAAPLMLLVTYNIELSIITIWHAWYIEERSLRILLRMRAEQKEAKARRCSSFLSANMGTGATTPAMRRRDGVRESFVAPGQLQGDLVAPQGTALARKPTQEEAEEALASQMDPDYIPAASQQPARENRRISSMNTDVRASQTTVNASFGVAAGRRATSFGGAHGRRSLSHRKSRGSTPGSIYGNSLGGDEGTMDLETTIEFDADESVEDILQHIRATFEATGTDSVFGNIEEGFRREVLVRKVHSFPVSLSTSSQQRDHHTSTAFTAATIVEPPTLNGMEDLRVRVFVHDSQSSEVRCVSLKVKQRLLFPGRFDAPTVAIPLLVSESTLDRCEGIIPLQDGHVRGVLFNGLGIQFTIDDRAICPPPTQSPYRVFEKFDLLSRPLQADKDVGRNRTMPPPSASTTLQHSGLQASYDEVAIDRTHHRRSVQFRAEDPQVEKLISVCEIMLPKQNARSFRRTWCMVLAWLQQHPENLASTACHHEFVALTSAIFMFVLGLLDQKARAALNIAKVAASKEKVSPNATIKIRRIAHESALLSPSAWSWIPTQQATSARLSPKLDHPNRDHLLTVSAAIADELTPSIVQITDSSIAAATLSATKIMLALHIYREEQKLFTLARYDYKPLELAPVISQLGIWLNLDSWALGHGRYYELEGASEESWAFVKSKTSIHPEMPFLDYPVSVFQWFEDAVKSGSLERYPTLSQVAQIGSEGVFTSQYALAVQSFTPRIMGLSDILAASDSFSLESSRIVQLLAEHGFTADVLETLPESIAAPFREVICRCEKEPPTSWRKTLLRLVGRDDLDVAVHQGKHSFSRNQQTLPTTVHDVHTACHALEHPIVQAKTKEARRHAVSQLIFSEDRRLVEATNLMHFNSIQVVQCPKQPDWDDDRHFQFQRKAVHWATIRMIALPAGDAMLHYDSQTPLLTEKFHLPGFSSSCLIQPMGYHLAPERTGLTEEKVNWAYFHAGVSAGLRISHNVKGIDTSWIAFNKPPELQNRHAGLLFALGLGGHLRRVAKWLLFKYLTPKHTMTSVGLLLGLAASYIGTMDGLVTRMLSVHITRMLPAGAAELNVTPATQAAGMMGIGLVYHNTQHRRMSEVMLSEIEYMEVEDPDSGPDPLRDESYRLSTGFALGLINLGKGNKLRGLHGMNLGERLLRIAVGPRPINAVHVFDRATAGAVIAIALVYMKSGDKAISRKIDIPDTEAQFDQVRPDILMLRAMARHIILWDQIEAKGVVNGQPGWIYDNMPLCYKGRLKQVLEHLISKGSIDSAHIPLFNVLAGLAWALSLRYAGSGNALARDEILELLNFFHELSSKAVTFYFDGKLGQSALRRCMDVLALSAATVMAGTGDLATFRYLRRMHGRVDAITNYGSHLAAHMAIGVLFLGGGTYTFGTSNLAIASLICAFYPLFPTDVQDNRVHLQAFRHLWVLAAEARCLVVEDIDTQRPIQMPLIVMMHDGSEKAMKSPCILPELDNIAMVQTNNPAYWRVTLDFTSNSTHLASFRKDQRIFVRRCPAAEAHNSIFSAALAALNDAETSQGANQQVWHTLFHLDAFKDLDRADIELLLPPDVNSSVYVDERGTVVDGRLALGKAVNSSRRDDLWNLRMLFAWAERARNEGDGKLRWIGHEVIEALKAQIEERARRAA